MQMGYFLDRWLFLVLRYLRADRALYDLPASTQRTFYGFFHLHLFFYREQETCRIEYSVLSILFKANKINVKINIKIF